MSTGVEQVIIGRDNEFWLFLLEQGVPLSDLSPLTRVLLVADEITIDSLGNGVGLIDWSETADWRPGQAKPVMKFKLGTSSLLPTGSYRGCRIITFDISNPNGVEWTRDLVIEVKP